MKKNFLASSIGFLLVSTLTSPLIAYGDQMEQLNPTIGVYRSGERLNRSSSYEPIVTRPSSTSAGTFNSNMLFLAEQIERNTDLEAKDRPTILATITDLDSLGSATTLGRLIGEHMLHQLHVLGWNTTDIRLTNDVFVKQDGEFILSRDIKKLKEKHNAANVLSGTYTVTRDGVLLTIRVAELDTGTLLSSAQTRLVKDQFVSHLLRKKTPLPVVKITN
jgi:TolB-like protein